MNLADLHRKLIASARNHPPGDHVPFAYERRIMAILAAGPVMDRWANWAAGLWRSAAACLTVTILLGAFSLLPPKPSGSSTNDLSQAFENTMLVAVNQDADTAW